MSRCRCLLLPTFASFLIESFVSSDVKGVCKLLASLAGIGDPAARRRENGGFERMVSEWAPAHLAVVTSTEVTHCTVQGERRGSDITPDVGRNGGTVDVYSTAGGSRSIRPSSLPESVPYGRRRGSDLSLPQPSGHSTTTASPKTCQRGSAWVAASTAR